MKHSLKAFLTVLGIALLWMMQAACSSRSVPLPPTDDNRYFVMYFQYGSLEPQVGSLLSPSGLGGVRLDLAGKVTNPGEWQIYWYTDRPTRQAGIVTNNNDFFKKTWPGIFGQMPPNVYMYADISTGQSSGGGYPGLPDEMFLTTLVGMNFNPYSTKVSFDADLAGSTLQGGVQGKAAMGSVGMIVLPNYQGGKTWSFAQMAGSAAFVPTDTPKVYTLKFEGVRNTVFKISHAPDRGFRAWDAGDLARSWKDLFGATPPNASLTGTRFIPGPLSGDPVISLLTLEDPVYDPVKAEMSYKATVMLGDIDDFQDISNVTLLIDAAGGDECTGGTMLATNQPADAAPLDVNGKKLCVGQGSHYYKNVNIYNGGSLVFLDAKSDFWASSILVEKDGSLIAGSAGAPVGTTSPSNVVTIHLYGDSSGDPVRCKTSDPSQGVECGVPGNIWSSSGSGKFGLPGGVNDYFYKYQTLPGDDTGIANFYFGRKTLAVSYGGTLQLFGKKGASYPDPVLDPANTALLSGTSWVRLDATAKAGATTLTVDRQVNGWQPGDMIVVTTTDYLPGHSETFQIGSIDATGKIITLQTGQTVQYEHNGTQYSAGKMPSRLSNLDGRKVDTRAAVGLLTRSVRIVSGGSQAGQDLPAADPGNPSPAQYYGGHTIVRQGANLVQMQGVEFYQMGQGGLMAHAPVNFHLARQTPANTFVKDCSVNESMNRWYVLRGTQNVTLSRNVGWESIGSGYFIADGSEINNVVQANLGVFARAGVDNRQNPRKVPGVLAKTENAPSAVMLSAAQDYVHPNVFWIANTWNDIDYNMAAGAGTCGSCYWISPGQMTGLSRAQIWEGYAGITNQAQGQSPGAPVKSFKGNTCSTAKQSLITVGGLDECMGVHSLTTQSYCNDHPTWCLQPLKNPVAYTDNLYPNVKVPDSFMPNLCSNTSCSALSFLGIVCAKGFTKNCAVTVFDGYTSSFHWAEVNFSAIWLRANWYLFINGALTDIQNGGLTMVSGGDYTQVFNGYWAQTRDTVFVGQTQPDNPFASNAGPVNPGTSLACEPQTPDSYCLMRDEGITMPTNNFNVYQRFFNIYDGPVLQKSNAYLDITTTRLDCPWLDPSKPTRGNCLKSGGTPSGYMYGQKVMGIPRDKVDPNNQNGCILPNAAIGWKQPNGFYYPPRFHSENLFFRNVDIRHFLIEPLFTPGTMNVDVAQVEQDYCKYPPGDSSQLFSASFTDVDRQTELNDDDGSLSGNVASISLNKDSFYTTPIEEIECMSAQSSKQVPYDFVTTAIYPYCRDTCFDPTTSQWWWSSVCQDRSCAGLPIYRQYYTTDEGGAKDAQKIQMMGAGIGQRSTLTAWLGDATKDPIYGKYYIQTNAQDDSMFKTNFQTGKNYYVFLLYTKPETKMQYQIYVGSGAGQDYLTSGVQMVRVGTKTGDPQVTLLNLPLQFAPGAWPSAWTKTYDSGTGILTVTVDMSAFKDDFTKGFQEFCGPSDYCTLDAGNTNCVCTDKAKAQGCYDDICAWAMTKALDCPSGGCLGFSFTLLGDDAHPGTKFEFDKDFRPAPEPYPASWVSAKFNPAGSKDLAGCCYQYDPNNPPVSPTCDWTQSGAGLDWLK